MFGMSQEQILGLVRQILPVLGGVAVSFGWLTTNQVSDVTATLLQIAGPIMIVGSAIWSAINKTKANLVSTVAALPEVKTIELKPTVAGTALADPAVTPPNVIIAR